METYRKERLKGASVSAAIEKALEAEHKGLTRQGILRYEGKLGAAARWH
jgi:hypothetical protein